MFSKNGILFSKKSKKGGKYMITKNLEDIKDTAIKLDEIRMQFPEDYFYLKGWIHCLLHKEERSNRQPRKPPKQTV